MERDIVIFGYDDDPDDAEFQRLTIPAKYDLDYALKEAIDKLDKKVKDGFKVHSGDTWEDRRKYVPILCYNDKIYDESRQSYYEDAKRFVVQEGGGYVYDLNNYTVEHVYVPSWDNRHKAKNTQEAIKHISAFMAQGFSRLDSKLDEVEAYAKKFDIPFSVDLMNQFRSDFDVYQSQWDSSSAYC